MKRISIISFMLLLALTGCQSTTNDHSSSNSDSAKDSSTTKDSSTWPIPKLPFQFDWEKHTQPEGVFLSTAAQGLTSWIMLTSEPAAGLMDKTLYKTSNGGKSWVYVKDVSLIVDGYVTGIAFRNDKNGWIAATQHGEALLPLYRTTDGGKTWLIQKIEIPAAYKYGNAYPPVFDPKNSSVGTLKIEFVNESTKNMTSYITSDGGQTWKPEE
ncbi:hypothetical protein Back11_36210 [Paenibacillus baekrokdamisoli]|uniref:Uncharacterized protein n=1 Tax=Paenibacillus baekrokdamisoli TaxID=1712516 RepID=A0A3G9IV12_9BACL|nr:hypothetical protein [Paenibacillus baekrokdamisoli]MBB3070782.1 photosystem II stability/assembly factor-like uncharacterized protein [Paenibacillus baekrokdamisoli]BBH22276.1 hypothetical protein Back11_36210 [Paenibacillus baekrokdamisoli]